jgi:hypothetical protein
MSYFPIRSSFIIIVLNNDLMGGESSGFAWTQLGPPFSTRETVIPNFV